MKSVVKLLLTSIVALLLANLMFAQKNVPETSEPTMFQQYAKAINEEAPFVRLSKNTFSNHSDSGCVAIQQDVYLQSNRTFADWEGIIRNGIVHIITSQYYERAHTVLLVNSTAEWESGPAKNFTITTSENSHAPTTQSELREKESRNDDFWVHFGALSENVTAYDDFVDNAGCCLKGDQASNKVVNYVNEFSNSQLVSLFYGPDYDNRVLQVWVASWQDRVFTGNDFSAISVDYGSVTAP